MTSRLHGYRPAIVPALPIATATATGALPREIASEIMPHFR